MQPANRVVLNTGFLYGRMLITIFVSLYSTRLILSALGAVDYGVFNLVGGVIGMLSFLNGAMAVSTQRYLSYYMGVGDMQKLKSIFQSSIVLHLVIGLGVVILLELGGLYFIDHVLNIPPDKVAAAKVVFHFMVVSTFFTINAVPYDASINAHENMLFDALTGVFEAVMKLGIAIFLIYTQSDKLILYSLMIASLTILIRIMKSIYCSKKYSECRVTYPLHIDRVMFREMFSFAGWNLFGSFSGVVRFQGLSIILNLFFGVIINAAYGIAYQVNSQLSSFSLNIIKALNPQIVKSEGYGDRERMLRLAMLACKMPFLLVALFAIPLIIEMHYTLGIWLKKVPDYSMIFCQLVLLITMAQQLTMGLMRAVQSIGNIRAYQVSVSLLLILNIPVAYLLIKLGFPAYSVLVSSIVIELLAGGARIWFARRLAGLNSNQFLLEVVLNSFITIIITALIAVIPFLLFKESFFRLILTTLFSSVSLIWLSSIIALTKEEKVKIVDLIKDFALLARKRFMPVRNYQE